MCMQLNDMQRHALYMEQLAAQQNILAYRYSGLYNLGICQSATQVPGPYKSDAMNSRLLAAKEWLKERKLANLPK